MITLERKFRNLSSICGLGSLFFVFSILFHQVFVTNGYKNKINEAPFSHSKENREKEVAVDAIEIPNPVLLGQTVQLKCIWRVGSRTFYQLKWFKDDLQFYSVFAGEKGRETPVEGIKVDVEYSDDHVVRLIALSPKAQGLYKCEIMTDSPRFTIGEKEDNLTVVKLPERPQILGLKEKYLEGETLNVTCRAINGLPAPILIFKINDKKIMEQSGRLTVYPTTVGDHPEFFTSETRLTMPIPESLQPEFNLSCYAVTQGLPVHTIERVLVYKRRSFFGSLFGASDKVKGNEIAVTSSIIVLTIINCNRLC